MRWIPWDYVVGGILGAGLALVFWANAFAWLYRRMDRAH